MGHNVWNIKTEEYIFHGTLNECNRFISEYNGDNWYLEVRAGL